MACQMCRRGKIARPRCDGSRHERAPQVVRHNRNAGDSGDAPNLPPDRVTGQGARGDAAVSVHGQQERTAGGAVVMGGPAHGAPVGKRSGRPRCDRDKSSLPPLAPRDRNLTAPNIRGDVARQHRGRLRTSQASAVQHGEQRTVTSSTGRHGIRVYRTPQRRKRRRVARVRRRAPRGGMLSAVAWAFDRRRCRRRVRVRFTEWGFP